MKSPNRKQKLIMALNEGNKEKLERLIEYPEKPLKTLTFEIDIPERKVIYEGREMDHSEVWDFLNKSSEGNDLILKYFVNGWDYSGPAEVWDFFAKLEDYPSKGTMIIR